MSNSNVESELLNSAKNFYTKKSKYFEAMKKDMCSKISVKDFVNFLSSAYEIDNTISENLSRNSCSNSIINNLDWVNVTRSSLFSELLDVEEEVLFNVIKETNDLDELCSNREFEVYDDCNYFFSLPKSDKSSSQSSSSDNSSSSSVLDFKFDVKLNDDSAQQKIVSSNTRKKKNSFRCNKLIEDTRSLSSTGLLKSEFHVNGSLQKIVQTSDSETGNDKNRIKLDKFGSSVCSELPVIRPTELQNCILNNMPKGSTFVKSSDKPFNKPLLNNQVEVSNETNQNIKICANDEVNKLTKVFTCPEKLLISKMGYFAEISATKKLEDLDITIECEAKIFEWVLDWIKYDSLRDENVNNLTRYKLPDFSLSLNATNVVSILACASYLKIDSLIDACLLYLKNCVNDLLKSSINFNCFNESVLTKFAKLFSNVEVESLKDKNDKLQSHVYVSLIFSLLLPEPEPWKGHFSTFANIFKCIHCKKFILPKLFSTIPCIDNCTYVDIKGKVLSLHEIDSNWSMTGFIFSLKKELKYWQKVYWRLWAECHFLYCVNCNCHFSVYTFNQCYYHPESVMFSEEQSCMVGRYPCCDATEYVYQIISSVRKGCKVKNHNPHLKNNRSSTDIMKIFDICQHLIFNDSSRSYVDETSTKFTSEVKSKTFERLKPNNFQNILRDSMNKQEELYCINRKHKRGLLDKVMQHHRMEVPCCVAGDNKTCENIINGYRSSLNRSKSKKSPFDAVNAVHHTHLGNELCEWYDKDENMYSSGCCLPMQDINKDENYFNKPIQYTRRTNLHKRTRCGLQSSRWVTKFSTRYNQDNQREYEEHVLTSVKFSLSKRMNNSNLLTGLTVKRINNDVLCDNDIDEGHSQYDLFQYSQSSISSLNSVTNDSVVSCYGSLNNSVQTFHSRSTSVWNSYNPLAGEYIRIESEWKDVRNYPLSLLPNYFIFHTKQQCKWLKKYTQNFMQNLNNLYGYKGENMYVPLQKVKPVPLLHNNKEACTKLWNFNPASQELEYTCALYLPVPQRRDLKFISSHLGVEWESLVSIEQNWCMFLKVFCVNEIFPSNKDIDKLYPKLQLHDYLYDIYKKIDIEFLTKNKDFGQGEPNLDVDLE